MRRSFSAAAALAATFCLGAHAAIPTCGEGSPCPQDTPCCSQYGQCGVGAYCLGGCDPSYSYSLDSCMAAPVCKSADYVLNSLNGIEANTEYLGDASKTNWVSSGQPVVYNDDSVLLTMAPNTVGTLLMSTHYVWYGKISATMSTSQGQGVVTAFIMMSDVKDEIDFEFVGVDLESAQSNFYWQGVTDYDNEQNISTSNTVQDVHTYTIDWQPDYISWAIDGNVGRTVQKKNTWNTTDNTFHFPQTPARIQLSLWPAGLSSNAPGTIAWSGGLINWDSPAMQNGYYYAMVKEVTVECYDPPSGTVQNGNKAYYYTDTQGVQNDVAMGNNNTILGSFEASGDNPSFNPNSASASSTATATPETVPGMSGGGNQGNSGQSSSGSGSGSGGSSGSSSSSSGSSGQGFVQGNPNDGSGSSSEASTVVAGSAVALLGFFVAALML